MAGTSGPILLHTKSAAAFLAGLLASMRLGRSVVCTGYGGRDYLCEIGAGAGVVVTDAEDASALSLLVNEAIGMAVPVAPVSGATGADFLSITFMTSGTTAKPKTVVKALGVLEKEAQLLETLWGGAPGPVYATVSHQHIYGLLFRVVWPVLAGRPSDARQTLFWEQLEGRLDAQSVLVSSPAHLSRFPAGAQNPLGRPFIVFSSGGPLAFDDAKACEMRLGQLPVEVFGSTETGGIAWRKQRTRDEPWTLFPGVKIDADEAGHLSVCSPLTGQAKPAVTGDLITLEGNGTFRCLGRGDRVVKLEGKRVSLTRVEQALLDLPGVRDAAALLIDAKPQALAAVVVLDDEVDRERQQQGAFGLSRRLRRSLTDRLEPQERPKAWRFVDRIPSNSQGKRSTAELNALFSATGGQFTEAMLGGLATIRAQARDSAEIDLLLDGGSVWFEGHFPRRPIFPGIAEVHLAVLWGLRVWNWRPATSHLTRVKFSRVLYPGDSVRLVLTRDLEKDTLRFAYHVADKVAGQGVIGGAR